MSALGGSPQVAYNGVGDTRYVEEVSPIIETVLASSAVLSAVTVSTTSGDIDTSLMPAGNVTVSCKYVRTGSSTGTVTVNGSYDGGTTWIPVLLQQLDGTYSSDGTYDFTTTENVNLRVMMYAPLLQVDWAETVDGATFTAHVRGRA